MQRRTLLSLLAAAAGAATAAILAVPFVGQALSPLRRRRTGADQEVDLGPVERFEAGRPTRVTFPITVEDGWTTSTEEQAAWVLRRSDGSVAVLSTICPHLGCSIKWRGKAFECPCHESEFATDGGYVRGPARRGMDELPSRVERGSLRVTWVEYAPGLAERRPLRSA